MGGLDSWYIVYRGLSQTADVETKAVKMKIVAGDGGKLKEN